MGRDFREVAKDITSALNLGEDEGKIDALAGSLEDAANKSFGHSSELHTKLVSGRKIWTTFVTHSGPDSVSRE